MKMKLSHFGFELPESHIAQHPVDFRDDARLMVVTRETGTIEHHHFRDLANFFEPSDLLVINNTKVFPARMWGNKEKTGALIEVFLLRELNSESRLWDVLVDPARKIRIGNKRVAAEGEFLKVGEAVVVGVGLGTTDHRVGGLLGGEFGIAPGGV
jgi:S-adenosylmethionine:tRNA ribosyltransferase-isomerase